MTVPSADITAALLHFPGQAMLVASVYVEGKYAGALGDGTNLLDWVIRDTRHRVGTRIDLFIAGDFNRHDQRWEGTKSLRFGKGRRTQSLI